MRQPGRLLAVAHRAGNSLAGLREALDAGVDLVEADVHAYRTRLEVRHHKTLGSRHLWDRWEIVRRVDAELVELSALMTALGAESRLMIDLKGVDPRLPGRVAAVLAAHDAQAPYAVCTKNWWMLEQFPQPVRRVLSVSNRAALHRLRVRLRDRPAHGVSVRLRLLTPEVVRELKTRTDVVMTWPVDTSVALERARALGVDAVIGKDLALLRSVVAGR